MDVYRAAVSTTTPRVDGGHATTKKPNFPRHGCRSCAKATKLGNKDVAHAACPATFSKAAREAREGAEERSLDKDNPATLHDITAAHDKVVKGRFELHLTKKAGQPMVVSRGASVAWNRQL